ncbi:Cationic peroxidase SPC4 [Triticum urartu]|uniref:Cationic peroxidase SPC4 n=1 Tax=Triticum urartu TaxID=4572 RepID=M7YP19_TRIUA|nr:Cationic peroxidase SPC4 [Triticum urartu]
MASSSGGAGSLVLAFVTVAVLLSPALSARLDGTGFHSATCPQLESIVRSSVQAALQREVALAAGLLRIFFHDCFPQGCDASVYLKGSGTEQAMGPNTTLQPRALQLVEDIRAKISRDTVCQHTQSGCHLLKGAMPELSGGFPPLLKKPVWLASFSAMRLNNSVLILNRRRKYDSGYVGFSMK